MTEEQLKSLAEQLSCPEGEKGIEVGNMMHEGNQRMTQETIQALQLQARDTVLELGHGNGKHLPRIVEAAEGIHYTGLEISEAMHRQANMLNERYVTSKQAAYILYDGDVIPFGDNRFTKIMTVNTLYFWSNAGALLREIHRVLKPNGVICIAFAQKDFMETLPFTRFGFTLYDTPTVQNLVINAGFTLTDVIDRSEKLVSKSGDHVVRTFSIVRATK